MAHGRPLQAKLYLEGKEVPFIGATMTHTVNQASIAYVDLVPHSSLMKIKPRTHVTIQIRDVSDTHTGGGFPYIEAWEGEVFGFNFGKSTTARSFSISCIDYTGYWDNVLTYFFNAEQSLGKGMNQFIRTGEDLKTIPATGAKLQPVTHASASYYIKIIKEVMADSSKDFLDAFAEVYKRTVNVNQFYMLAEERLRLIDRMRLRSSGELGKILEATEAIQWLSDIVSKNSGWATLRSVIQDLMSLIFHDYTTVPFPGRMESDSIDSAKALKSSSNKNETIGNFIFKPNLFMIPPPMCNTFFPDEYSSFQFSRNFFKEPTRLIYQPEMPIMLTNGTTAMPYVFEPPSFNNYQQGKQSWDAYQDDAGAFGVPKFDGDADDPASDPDFPGYNGEENPDPFKESMAQRREGQFLTNEEMLKGIWMAWESMVPASTSFRQNLNDAGKSAFSQMVAKYLFHKKRFQGRNLQITSHLKPSVVPGFNVLILDDSPADQNMVAYCTSVTHRIYATEGGYTNVTLSYARPVMEEDEASNAGKEPLIPPWFSEHIFGSIQDVGKDDSEAAKDEVAAAQKALVTPAALSDFYKELLGEKGYKAVTNLYRNERTLRGSVRRLLDEYRLAKAGGNSRDVQDFISTLTSRKYVRTRDTFKFLGATTSTEDLSREQYIVFSGDAFNRKGKLDETVVKLKQSVIDEFISFLKSSRGFRG